MADEKKEYKNLRYGLWSKDGQYGKYIGGNLDFKGLISWINKQAIDGNTGAFINVTKNDKKDKPTSPDYYVTFKGFQEKEKLKEAKPEVDFLDPDLIPF